MRDVKGDGKDEGERGQRKEERAAGKKEPCQPDDNSKQSDGIPKKDEAYEQGVGLREIPPRGFRAEPCGDDPAAKELKVECRMSAHKARGLEPFLVQKLRFSFLAVEVHFFVAGNPFGVSGLLVQ